MVAVQHDHRAALALYPLPQAFDDIGIGARPGHIRDSTVHGAVLSFTPIDVDRNDLASTDQVAYRSEKKRAAPGCRSCFDNHFGSEPTDKLLVYEKIEGTFQSPISKPRYQVGVVALLS